MIYNTSKRFLPIINPNQPGPGPGPGPDYSTMPLTFKAIDGPITIRYTKNGDKTQTRDINYSIDNGNTWTQFAIFTNITIQEGQSMILTGSSQYWSGGTDYWRNKLFFMFSGNVEIQGNITSLTESKVPTWHGYFNGVFSDTWSSDANIYAHNLYLPEFNIGTYNSHYINLFKYSTALKTAPVIRSSTVDPSSYFQMFYGCTNLSSMEVEFTNYDNSNNAFTNWVSGVVAAGTFTKPASLTNMPSGNNGIPTNWTVVDK